MNPTRKKQLAILTLAFAVVALLTYGFWPNPIRVDTGRVTRGSMQLTVEEEGRTRVKDRYILSVPVSGILQRLELEVGSRLVAGAVVARIRPAAPVLLDERQYAVAGTRLDAARAGLEQARENLAMAIEEAAYSEKEWQRVEDLHRTGIGSDQDLDRALLANRRARTNRVSAEFGVRIAGHEVESARAALQWAVQTPGNDNLLIIRSPVDGVVLELPNKSERPVMTGEPLLQIGNPLSLEIRADLLSTDAVRVEPATRVMVKRWGGERILEGRVRMVEPAGYTKISALGVEEQRVPVLIDLISGQELWGRLGDGYRVVAEFILWEGEEILQVPTSALFRSGEEWALFGMENGRANRRPVLIGHQTGLFTEVLGGLREGDWILTHPDERIEEGVRVEPRQ